MKKRTKGFYWVLLGPKWVVAEWTGKFWFTPGSHIEWSDADFNEIAGHRLM